MKRRSLIGSPLLNSIRKAACPSSPGESSSTMTQAAHLFLSETSPRAMSEASRRGCLWDATVFASLSVATPDGFPARTTFLIMESPGRSRRVIEYWKATDYQLSRLLDSMPTEWNGGELWSRVSTLPETMRPVVREQPALLFSGWRDDHSHGCDAVSLELSLFGGPIPDTCSKPTSSISKCADTAWPNLIRCSDGRWRPESSEWRSN